jgi:hypothetical protein
MIIWYVYIFQFWYFVPIKIWQPCSPSINHFPFAAVLREGRRMHPFLNSIQSEVFISSAVPANADAAVRWKIISCHSDFEEMEALGTIDRARFIG